MKGGNHSSHLCRISGKAHIELFLYGLVHKPMPIPEALKTPEDEAAVKKEWEKLKNPPAWHENKAKPKTAGVPRANK